MNIPKIRFKGFEEEWTEMPFTSIAQRMSSSGTSGILPGVEFEDIISGEGLLNKNVCDKSCNKIGKLFSCGDVLFGKLRPYLRNILLANFDGVAIGDFWVLRPEGIESKLLYELVNSAAFMHIANISSGSKMPRADWTCVSEASFAIPYATEEQKKISSYFTAIDEQISALIKLIEKLRQMKEASLQAMFPTDGETIPKVRFKGFDGEWKKVKLGEIGSTYTGLTGKSKDDFGVGNAKYITFLNVLNNAQIDASILESVNVLPGEHQNAVQIDDLFFNTSSETPEEVGMCSVLTETVHDVYLNSFCFGYRLSDDEQFAPFLAYLMRSQIGRRIMSILAQGATRFNLSKNNFMKSDILVPPSLAEQQKIASYFTALDQQISTQTKRLEKLRQIKSACLDAMFV